MSVQASLSGDAPLPETRREVSDMLGISQATLRTWDRLFRQWLETPVGRKGNATRKRYTPNDVRVFQLIKQRRDEGQTFAEIKTHISADLESVVGKATPEPVESEPAPPAASPGEPSAAPPRTVPDAPPARVYELELELTSLRAQLRAVTDERDALRARLDAERQRRVEAEKEVGYAMGQVELLSQLVGAEDPAPSGPRTDSLTESTGETRKKKPPSWWRGFER